MYESTKVHLECGLRNGDWSRIAQGFSVIRKFPIHLIHGYASLAAL